ncbi:MAG: hypothetical protein M1838_005819 [Thelocarpon superellum]|nr:MAG: hypothetical protein M1838_005819 [Thelocarpon superellum]
MSVIKGPQYPMVAITTDKGMVGGGGGGMLESKTHMNRDEQDMAYFGKKQQLKRNFGFLSIVGLSVTLMGTWESLFSAFTYGLTNGGPAGLVYGYIFCWIGTWAVTASLAELASAIPLSGGQYNWVSYLAPQWCAKFLSYMTGWMTVLGWLAGMASLAFLGGTVIQGLLVLNYDSYVFERWHGTLLFYAVMAICLFINTVMASWLPKVEGLMFITHIVSFFGILVPLVYFAPHGSASDVFATFVNGGGWSSNGVSFFVGIITSVYAFVGTDSACHMAEEIQDASTVVPWCMMTTMAINGVLGFGMLLAILFCVGDVNDALNTPTGYPFIEIFFQATESVGGATAMTAVVAAEVIFAAVGILATSSRMLWAFSRDNGVPYSKYIGRVDTRTGLPLWSIMVCTVISLLLALINIGSTAAFNAMASLVAAGFLTSYLISIGLLLYRRYTGDKIRWGPWNMGRYGGVVNMISIVYIVISCLFSFFPGTATVTLIDMNWSCVVFGAVVVFSLIFYVIYARHTFKGPVVEVHDD